MILPADTFLGDAWRTAVTLLALLVIGVFWYLIVSNITPFSGPKPKVEDHDESDEPSETAKPRRKYPQLSPTRFPGVQRFSVTADIILFAWIVLEGVIVVPLMLIKYGLH